MAFLQSLRNFWVVAFEYGAQNKNPEMTENLFDLLFLIHFCVSLSLFLVANDVITLFNSFFRNFRDFHGFVVSSIFEFSTCPKKLTESFGLDATAVQSYIEICVRLSSSHSLISNIIPAWS